MLKVYTREFNLHTDKLYLLSSMDNLLTAPMKNPWVRGFLLLSVVIIGSHYAYIASLSDCVKRINYDGPYQNEDINKDSLFRPIDSLEIKRIHKFWQDFKLESDSGQIFRRLNYSPSREMAIVEHYAEGRKHYGAILLPANYDETRKYPLLLWANGLNQSDPSVKLNSYSIFEQLARELKDYFVIVPSFRGQALVINTHRYCSDGFFGDAFDGATDDALRLLYWTQTNFQTVDPERLAVYGVSRGGTVALLAGSRQPNLNCIVAQTGPTDFLSKSMSNRHKRQYQYQFLSQTNSLPDIRTKIIKSSPLHFIEGFPNDLLLVYGKNDQTVSLVNGKRVVEKLKDKPTLEYAFLEGGHTINYTQQTIDWIRLKNK